jgi:hypothetical protein
MNPVAPVLKKGTVRQAGPVHLGTPSGQGRPAAAGKAASPAQARILEQDEHMALVEVVCPCGCRMVLQCLTGPAAATPKPDEPVRKEPTP